MYFILIEFGCRCIDKHNPIQFLLTEDKVSIAYWPSGHEENLHEHAMVALIFQMRYKHKE